MTLQRLTILGSTGSIGTSTLDVVARHPERFEVFALTASQQVDLMWQQCQTFRPRHAVMVDPQAASALSARVRAAGLPIEVHSGASALDEVASHEEVDAVMAAIVGAAGLSSCLAAAHAGKRLLLANKEALVVGCDVFMHAVREGGATLLPIDSEHSAIFQSLPEDPATWRQRVEKIILTASGGPFRTWDVAQLREVTPEQACAHPNWVMGRKISVDSATMMNKALEVIEAHWLFGAAPDQIEVVIHPQSVIHSMVSYADGSVLAQLGNPDMRTPIAHALAYPERIDSGVEPIDLARIAQLHFRHPDYERFPCLRLAFEALRAGGSAAAVMNAANEVAVEAFLDRKIGFRRIPELIATVLDRIPNTAVDGLDSLLAQDRRARDCARELVRTPY